MPNSTPPPATRRSFHVGDVLSLVTGVVLSPRGPLGIQALYAHLLGRPVPLGEAQAMHAEVRAHVLAYHPALATFAAAEVPTFEFVPEWLARRERELGTYLAVPPLPSSHPWRRTSALPPPLQAAFEAEANGGWASIPVSWLRYPSHDPLLGWTRPELAAQPSTAARPRTTVLGGTGRVLPDSARPLGERGVTPAPATLGAAERVAELSAGPTPPPASSSTADGRRRRTPTDPPTLRSHT